jgi:hypothetical protein
MMVLGRLIDVSMMTLNSMGKIAINDPSAPLNSPQRGSRGSSRLVSVIRTKIALTSRQTNPNPNPQQEYLFQLLASLPGHQLSTLNGRHYTQMLIVAKLASRSHPKAQTTLISYRQSVVKTLN